MNPGRPGIEFVGSKSKRGGTMLRELASLQEASTAFVDEARGVIWVAQADGSIKQVSLSGGGDTGRVRSSPVVGMAGSGAQLALAHADGSIALVDAGDPAARRKVVSRSKARYGQIGMTGSAVPTIVAVKLGDALRDSRPLGLGLARAETSLVLVKSDDGRTSSIPVDGLSGVAVSGKSVYVARSSGLRGRGQVGMVRGSVVAALASGLPPAGRLGLAEDGALLLVAHPGARAVSAVRPATGSVETVSTASIAGDIVEIHGLADGRFAILTRDVLALIDSLADLVAGPRIDPIGTPLFVGSWTELGFHLGNSGLGKGDVHFDVPGGPDVGFVSYARPNDKPDPVPLLVAGGRPGTYRVRLIETATSAELARTDFEITDHWRQPDIGPSGFYVTTSRFSGDSGWGGGPSSPQNMSTQPHNGTWRSLVLMVDTSSGRWPTDAPTMTANQTAILGHITNGIAVGPDNRSVRQYYEENSQYTAGTGGAPDRGLTLGVRNSQTYGPVSLPGSWTDYFLQYKDKNGVVTDQRWWSQGATLQTIITRAINDGIATTADFTDLDLLIMVVFSVDPPGAGARFVWPHANPAQEFLCGTNSMTDRRSFAWTYVPLDFAAQDGRQLHTTLSHELGHTLGLPDLYDFPEYSDDVTARITGGWDMMAGSRDALPHYTLSNKMRMGWIPAGHLKLYNFQGSNAAAENVTLHAAELGDPPAGRVKGIEIRLGDGWNYYVEYRAEQAAQVTDALPTDRRVVITDVTSDTYTAPISRPPILLVHSDVDGDGPILGTGSDLEEKDPGTQMDLKVEVISTAADNAVVKISYGANGKPEPGIRPWTGGPNWQSPDIEVRNDRALADPGTYFNTPWLGHDNVVVAKVRNSGDLLAKSVVVDFFVTEYTTGDGPWASLGLDTKDIAPGAVAEFTASWNPGSQDDRHYCIIVRIRLYQDPGNLAVIDQNIYNNEARSNYTQFISASASPSTRAGAKVLLANPFDASTLVFADVKKTHPQHRVFVDHQWLRVAAKGQRAIQVWDEALWGTPEWSLVVRKREERLPKLLWEVPNRLSVSGWAVRPFRADCGARTLTGGVGMRVDAGRATDIRLRSAKPNFVSGLVTYTDNSDAVKARGTVLIGVSAGPGRYFTVTAELGPDGHFAREFSNEFGTGTISVEAHYLGAVSAAPCTTGPVLL
jgi:M6 family metalloprotease-like protein